MAKIDFNSIESNIQSNSNNNKVSFFFLKNNGDEAIVRFMIDSVADFDIQSTHRVDLDNKKRAVGCIRDAIDPLDKCPFCAAGFQIFNRFYIRLLQYDKTPEGKIAVSAKVWDRPILYANRLKELINMYGPLSDCLMKITRIGNPGSTSTDYNIMYYPSNTLNINDYPKITDAFNNYSVLKTFVLDKSADDMRYYLSYKTFPASVKPDVPNETRSSEISPAKVEYTEVKNSFNVPPAQFNNNPSPSTISPIPTNIQPNQTPAQRPWEQNTTVIPPVRRY